MNEDEIDAKFRVGNFGLNQLSSDELADRIRMAVNAIEDLAYHDGERHKQYAINYGLKILLGDKYSLWREGRMDWDDGTAP
jgi:hypothetical protein